VWHRDDPQRQRAGAWRIALLYQMPRLCFSLAILLGRRRRDAVVPELLPVSMVVELAHPADEFQSVLLPVGAAPVALAELSAAVPPVVAYERLDGQGTVVELRQRLSAALGLAETVVAS